MSRLDQLYSMLKEDPKDDFLQFAIAKEYEKNDQLEDAVKMYVQLKENNQDYIGLYYHLAHCYAELDQVQDAMTTYELGISIAKKLSDFHALSELVNAKKNLELESL